MTEPAETVDEQEREQRELVRPPDLNQRANRSATRLELFFDLAFVLFVARCADLLAKDETWRGGLIFAALLTVGWWAWASTTLYANRFDTDDAIFRVLTLIAMGGVVAMAAGVDKLGGPTGRWFALAYAVVRLVLVVGYLRAWRHVPAAHSVIPPYLFGHAAGAAIWLVSAATPAPARYVLWGVGIAVDLIGPTLAARRRHAVPLHLEHLPERFGLFVILVLGESVAAVVTGIHDGGWKPAVVLTAGLAFLMTACLWWLYFDLAGGAAKRRLVKDEEHDEEHDEEGTHTGVHDFYVYSHLPLAIALAAVAVGIEHAVLHGADDHLTTGTRWVLGIGLAGYLAGAGLVQATMSRAVIPSLRWPGAGVPLVLIVTALDLRPWLMMTLLAAILLVGLSVGIAQQHKGQVRTAKT